MTAKDFKMIYDLHFDDLRRYLTFRSGDQDLSGDIAQNYRTIPILYGAKTSKIIITLLILHVNNNSQRLR